MVFLVLLGAERVGGEQEAFLGDDSLRLLRVVNDVQQLLADRGQHRAPSIPDLLIAAAAELATLTVLHVDKDFELIAEVTGQPVERLKA